MDVHLVSCWNTRFGGLYNLGWDEDGSEESDMPPIEPWTVIDQSFYTSVDEQDNLFCIIPSPDSIPL